MAYRQFLLLLAVQPMNGSGAVPQYGPDASGYVGLTPEK
jgi:hypothetical protein